MDLISNRTIEITKLGMDGLLDRQHAISSNIANVMTPDYQRKEVAFESQLSEIIEKEDLKDFIKGQNSIDEARQRACGKRREGGWKWLKLKTKRRNAARKYCLPRRRPCRS